MTPDDKEYVDRKFAELHSFLSAHEIKDHEAFEKIYHAINGTSGQIETGLARLDLVLGLVKSLHGKASK